MKLGSGKRILTVVALQLVASLTALALVADRDASSLIDWTCVLGCRVSVIGAPTLLQAAQVEDIMAGELLLQVRPKAAARLLRAGLLVFADVNEVLEVDLELRVNKLSTDVETIIELRDNLVAVLVRWHRTGLPCELG